MSSFGANLHGTEFQISLHVWISKDGNKKNS